jgi:hypothetical protein
MVLTALRRPLPSASGVAVAERLAGSEMGEGSVTARADDEVMKWERGRAVSGCRDMAMACGSAGTKKRSDGYGVGHNCHDVSDGCQSDRLGGEVWMDGWMGGWEDGWDR